MNSFVSSLFGGLTSALTSSTPNNDISASTSSSSCNEEEAPFDYSVFQSGEEQKMCLLRFLRAEGGDVQKANKKFRETHAWRKSVGADDILTRVDPLKEWPCAYEYVPWGILNHDKEGNPLGVVRHGLADVYGVLKYCTEADMRMNEVYRSETCSKILAKCGKQQVTVISDLTGLGFEHFTPTVMSAFKVIATLGDAYYPERLRRIIVINAPVIFSAIWAVVSNFFAPKTIAKVQIISGDPLPTLLKYIDEDQLPAFLGGKYVSEDGDPECKKYIVPAGKVPEGYPANNKSRSAQIRDGDIENESINGDIYGTGFPWSETAQIQRKSSNTSTQNE